MNGLRYIMQLEGLTTSDVAKKLKVNRSLISIWQTGRREIPEERLNQFAAVFPKYPVYYYNKELTIDDMETLREIKLNGRLIAAPPRDERMNRVESVINNILDEQSKVLSEVAEILKMSDYAQIMKNAKNIGDKQMIEILFSVTGSERERYLHDYRILNKLERMRRTANDTDYFKYFLVGIAMSALAAAFGIEDDVASLTDTRSMRAIIPSEMIENSLGIHTNIELFNKWRDKITSVFNEVIEECNDREKELEANAEKKRKCKMIIEFLNDVIEDTPERKDIEEINARFNKTLHSKYDVSREHKDADCQITTTGSSVFESVGKFLISDKSEECCITDIIIDAHNKGISLVCYINGDEKMIEENVSQKIYEYLLSEKTEEYHKLCEKIIDSALIYME